MDIVFYKISDAHNMLDKTLGDGVLKRGVLRDNVSILTPIFTLDTNVIPDYNYCYIDAFKRYYYITDITSVNNRLVSIECRVDVLMSFKDDIENSYAKVRKRLDTSPYYDKVDIGTEVRKDIEILEFPYSPLDEDGTIVLVALNGVGVV